MDIYYNIAVVSLYTSVIPLMCGIYFFRKSTSAERVVVLYFFAFVFVEFLSFSLSRKHLNNIWIDNLFIGLELILFLKLFSIWMKEIPRARFFYVYVVWIFLWILSTCKLMGTLYEFNVITHCSEAIILITLSGISLIKLSEHTDSPMLSSFRFWTSFAILLNSSTNLIVYSLGNVIIIEGGEMTFWVIHSVSTILTNLIYSIGFVCLKNK